MRRSSLFGLTLIITILICWSFPCDAGETLVFSDDFSGNLEAWDPQTGTWTIENGKLRGYYTHTCGSTTCTQGDLLLDLAHTPSTGDWRIEADFFLIRYPSYYYYTSAYFSVWNTSNDKERIGVGSYWETLGEVPTSATSIRASGSHYKPWDRYYNENPPIAWNPHGSNRVVLEKIGSTYTLRMNGEEIAVIEDSRVTAPSRIGVHIYGVTQLDNIAVYEITGGGSSSFEYVALGDSYSAGEGAGDYKIDLNNDGDSADFLGGLAENTDRKNIDECHRSKWAWSTETPGKDASLGIESVLVGTAAIDRKFAACSGAIISDLFNERRREDEPPEEAWYVPPQEEVLSADADLVTLTVGGNDAQFADVLKACLIKPTCHADYLLGFSTSLEESTNWIIDVLGTERLQLAYENLKDAAPNASVFVLGYPNLTSKNLYPPCFVPPDMYLVPWILGAGHPFDASEVAFFRRMGERLNRAVECSALRAGVHWVPVEQEFKGHEYCGPWTDWINGLDRLTQWSRKTLRWKEAFHPNKAGQKAYATALRKKITELGVGAYDNPEPLVGPELPDYCSDFEKSAPNLKSSGPPKIGSLVIDHATTPICDVGMAFSPGEHVISSGTGFDGSTGLQVRFSANDGSFVRDLPSTISDPSGDLSQTIVIPNDAPAEGLALIEVAGASSQGGILLLMESLVMVDSLTNDGDYDGVPNACDNCPDTSNTNQSDLDNDGIGDVCDTCPADPDNDLDHDGLCGDVDSCPFDPYNDANGDGICGEVDGGFFADGFEIGDAQKWSAAIGTD